MKFNEKQKELYKLVLKKSKESGQKPLYVAMELVKTNPEKFNGLKFKSVMKVIEEANRYLAVEIMKNAAFGEEEEKTHD